jgi:hypothetical protein
MTKKDYIAIAACIKAEWDSRYLEVSCYPHDEIRNRAIYSLHKRIADVFKADNPHFNRDKFTKACGF